MDENRNNGFGNNPRTPSGFDPYYGRQTKKNNDFKVNISDFEGIPDTSQPQRRAPARRTPESVDDKFKVTLPSEQRTQPRQQPKRTAPSSAAKRTAPPAAKKPAARKNTSGTKGGQTPGGAKKAKAKRKDEMSHRAMIVCACLIVIAAMTAILSSVALGTINDILALDKTESETVSVVIPEEADSFNEVYSILCDNGLVRQKQIIKLFCKFRHYDEYRNPKYDAKKAPDEKQWLPVIYEPGVYYLETGSGIEAMLDSIKASRGVSNNTVRLTFPEGWSVAQIFAKIEKYQVCSAEKLYANLDIVGKQFDFYQEIPNTTGRYLKAEGYLYPDTYDFFIGENAGSVLKKLFSNYQKKWDSECEKKAKELGLTVDEVMNIAAIIQREAKGKTQMADISSVIHNRLAKKATYPLLEMNSTKDYIVATKEFGVFDDSYYSIYLNSYNTYSTEGLPPGPICNPGMDAIYAALHPANTGYYFFCHDKDGNIYLAATASEQQRNIQKNLLYD